MNNRMCEMKPGRFWLCCQHCSFKLVTGKPLLGCRQPEAWHPWEGSSTQATSGLGRAGKRNFSPCFPCPHMPQEFSVDADARWALNAELALRFQLLFRIKTPCANAARSWRVVQHWALVSAPPEQRMPRQATSSWLGNFSRMVCGSCDKDFACKDCY